MDSWPTKLTESKGEMYPMIYQELACIGGIAIDRELEMFPQNMKNAPQREVLNVMMEESGGFLTGRVENNQRVHVPNDIPRADMHSWHGH